MSGRRGEAGGGGTAEALNTCGLGEPSPSREEAAEAYELGIVAEQKQSPWLGCGRHGDDDLDATRCCCACTATPSGMFRTAFSLAVG